MFIVLILMDLYALLSVIFHDYFSFFYIMCGVLFPLMKGSFFAITSGDILSFFDIFIGLMMIVFFLGFFSSFLFWTIFFYFIFKLLISMTVFV